MGVGISREACRVCTAFWMTRSGFIGASVGHDKWKVNCVIFLNDCIQNLDIL
jgi:hypothetical protein